MPEKRAPRQVGTTDELAARILGALEVAIESSEWDAAEHLLLALEVLNKRHACARLLDDAYGLVARHARRCR